MAMSEKGKKELKSFLRFLFSIGILVTIVGAFVGGFYAYEYLIESQKPINQVGASIKADVRQDHTLLTKSQQLGIDVSRVNLTYANSTEQGATGDFKEPNNIDVNPGQDDTTTLRVLSHEYYHYYWKNFTTPDQKTHLNNVLIDFYNSDTWLQNRMKPYIDKGCKDECFADELHSISCTEIPNYVLAQEFRDYCNSIVPNRSLFIQ